MPVDHSPDQPQARWHPSPNCGARRGGAAVSLIVLHYTAMADIDAALARLCDPAAEVSCHYVIGADGTLWQLVPEAQRAWHAGRGSWGGAADVNSRSIGIELDNRGATPFSAPQMERLSTLLRALLARYALPCASVIGHSDMAPARKSDPGRRFDWRALARQGLSVWPDHSGPSPAVSAERFLADARAFGYPELPLEPTLEAVRQRFRPAATGPLETEDMAAMADLAARYAVDRPNESA